MVVVVVVVAASKMSKGVVCTLFFLCVLLLHFRVLEHDAVMDSGHDGSQVNKSRKAVPQG